MAVSLLGAVGEWIRSLFFDNIGLKLASFFLALLLYAHVVTEQQRESTLQVAVGLSGLADTLAIRGAAPAHVDVTVRGKWKDLIRLGLSSPLLTLDLAGIGPGPYVEPITAEKVAERAFPPELAKLVEVTAIGDPGEVAFAIEPRAEKWVAVRARLAGAVAPGWRLAGAPEVRPESVQVSGPLSAVEAADTLDTLPVDITEEREKIQREVSVDTGTAPLIPEPRRIVVTLRLARVASDSAATAP
ncbi:MAG TPA: YbbR-like domain-containing protein [Candidatus Eisenbacteria bacterium]|nr:YbbR-like domain-containing protein [Candidatus Eisenbacteria bacterium]